MPLQQKAHSRWLWLERPCSKASAPAAKSTMPVAAEGAGGAAAAAGAAEKGRRQRGQQPRKGPKVNCHRDGVLRD